MIYTVTLNPSIDHIVRMDSPIRDGETNRCASEDFFIGGKGINVSTILKELGAESTAMGFVAGFTGREIAKAVADRGIESDFTELTSGNTRINIKLKGASETEINGVGPEIPIDEFEKLKSKISHFKTGDILILAGSVPASLPADTYRKLLEAADSNVMTIVDASGGQLLNSLKAYPFLIKPNIAELRDALGSESEQGESIQKMCAKMRNKGARNILVSMGAEGAMLCTENGDVFTMKAAKGELKNSVGSGDSMLAGFIYSYLADKDLANALKMGVAAGGATAFNDDLATREMIYSVLDTLPEPTKTE